jgi:glycosyltransferase involved in cell wall biosynthesis
MKNGLGRRDVAGHRRPDLICFSHLRWNFVFQRPQHLMVRFARDRRVYFVEEPIIDDAGEPWVQLAMHDGVVVVVPHLPSGLSECEAAVAQRTMLDRLIATEDMSRFVLWYYTPMALKFSEHLEPFRVAYDCMDELSAFKGASSDLPALEKQLLRRADVVFTGGQSLFEAKKTEHPNIHAVPSSVDVAHFAAARHAVREPADQRNLPHPRLGFFGVLDERLDIPLVGGLAEARPAWQLVMIGPVVKIDPADLPRHANIHYLGAKTYAELPLYLGGWSVALLPFARNEATRFISPTKTPEYLAAGRPVVSTSIRDVVSPYGERGLVAIADTVDEMVQACDAALHGESDGRRARADAFLRGMSWDATWSRMSRLLDDPATGHDAPRSRATLSPVQASAAAASA